MNREHKTAKSLIGSPNLREAFQKLKSGRHISVEDGELYYCLRTNCEHYTAIFSGLDFELIAHPKGFYYFQGKRELSKEASRQAVFFFILVQHWGDEGLDLREATFRSEGYAVKELPHFTRSSWRTCMTEVGVEVEEDLEQILRSMERLGFVERNESDRFRFKPPIWRFFDLCRDIFEESQQQGRLAGSLETPASSPVLGGSVKNSSLDGSGMGR